MFKKPSESAVKFLKVVNLDTLGSDKAVKKGKFTFIPLFRVTDSGPGIGLPEIEDATYPWFHYQFRKRGDEPNKPKTVHIYWMDTLLRAGENDATLNDPGVTLGLNLPAAQRKNIQGFGVPSLGFPDKDAYRRTVRVPVIWNVEPRNDAEGNIDPKSGELVLLELKEFQFQNLVAKMREVTKPQVSYVYFEGNEEKKERYPYQGYGFAYRLDKDTGRGMKTYEWSKTDMTVAKAHWENQIEAAVKAFEDYKLNAYKVGRPYESAIQACMNGEVPFADAEKEVVAIIAKKLLDAWGVSYGDTVDDILATFNEVAPNFSYAQGAGISQAGTGAVKVDLDDSDDESEPF